MGKYAASKKKKESEDGYKVGVFKNGKMKKLLSLHEGNHYVKNKIAKEMPKEKRKCSPAQLAALARGRATREQNRSFSSGGVNHHQQRRRKRQQISDKDARFYKDSKNLSRSNADKTGVRRAKE